MSNRCEKYLESSVSVCRCDDVWYVRLVHGQFTVNASCDVAYLIISFCKQKAAYEETVCARARSSTE